MSITGKSGRGSDRRPVLPDNIVRMDDDEVFRLFFENDWDVGGVVTFVYDGDEKNYYEERLEAGDIFCHGREFVYRRTRNSGEGHLLEIKFCRDRIEGELEDPAPFSEQFMLINNDYDENGRAIQYGQTGSGTVVLGKQTDPNNDPDKLMWADPR